MALTAGRLGGNLAQVTWAGSAGADSQKINVAEAHQWNFPVDFEVEDTTPLATDSPRVDVNMRRPSFIDIRMFVTGDAAPGGIPRMPTLALRNTGYALKLFIDKNDATTYWQCSGKVVGLLWGGRAKGGPKQVAGYRFVPDGALTLVNGGSSTSIE